MLLVFVVVCVKFEARLFVNVCYSFEGDWFFLFNLKIVLLVSAVNCWRHNLSNILEEIVVDNLVAFDAIFGIKFEHFLN